MIKHFLFTLLFITTTNQIFAAQTKHTDQWYKKRYSPNWNQPQEVLRCIVEMPDAVTLLRLFKEQGLYDFTEKSMIIGWLANNNLNPAEIKQIKEEQLEEYIPYVKSSSAIFDKKNVTDAELEELKQKTAKGFDLVLAVINSEAKRLLDKHYKTENKGE